MHDDQLTQASILIVDDQFANVRVLERLLQQYGYTAVTSTTDSREVLPLCVEHAPDLILLDLQMPGMDGWEIFNYVRALDQRIRVVLMTVSRRAQPEAERLAFDGFLPKPFDITEMLAVVRRMTALPA